MMRSAHLLLLGAILFWSMFGGTPTRADDAAACSEGIAALRVDIAKSSPEVVPDKIAKALRIAEREQAEGEFDECLDALEDARRARAR